MLCNDRTCCIVFWTTRASLYKAARRQNGRLKCSHNALHKAKVSLTPADARHYPLGESPSGKRDPRA